MMPSELRNALNNGIEYLKEAIKDQVEFEVVRFNGVYSNYYMNIDNDNYICLCADGYGYLTKVNPKRSTAKIARIFYVDITEKVVK